MLTRTQLLQSILRKLAVASTCTVRKQYLKSSAIACNKYFPSHPTCNLPLEEGHPYYEEPQEPPPLFTGEGMRFTYHVLKHEFTLLADEIRQFYKPKPIIYRFHETDIVWRFDNEELVNNWRIGSDSDFGEGYSHCKFEFTPNCTGRFSGVLSTKLKKTGLIVRSGYCLVKAPTARKSFYRRGWYNWEPYNVLDLRVRGDGRTYLINIYAKGFMDLTWHDIFQYPLYTRGGPYWQTTRIPLQKFIFAARGRIQDKQRPIDLQRISSFGFVCADKVNGPFELEIDYIGLARDEGIKEKSPYETYRVPAGVVNN